MRNRKQATLVDRAELTSTEGHQPPTFHPKAKLRLVEPVMAGIMAGTEGLLHPLMAIDTVLRQAGINRVPDISGDAQEDMVAIDVALTARTETTEAIQGVGGIVACRRIMLINRPVRPSGSISGGAPIRTTCG